MTVARLLVLVFVAAAGGACGGATRTDDLTTTRVDASASGGGFSGDDASTSSPDVVVVPPSDAAADASPGVAECNKMWTAPNYTSYALKSNWSCMVEPKFRCKGELVCCAYECITWCKVEYGGMCLELTPMCVPDFECLSGGVLPYMGPADGGAEGGA